MRADVGAGFGERDGLGAYDGRDDGFGHRDGTDTDGRKCDDDGAECGIARGGAIADGERAGWRGGRGGLGPALMEDVGIVSPD